MGTGCITAAGLTLCSFGFAFAAGTSILEKVAAGRESMAVASEELGQKGGRVSNGVHHRRRVDLAEPLGITGRINGAEPSNSGFDQHIQSYSDPRSVTGSSCSSLDGLVESLDSVETHSDN